MHKTRWLFSSLSPLFCLHAAVSAGLAQNVITTFAGTAWQFNGEGQPATEVPLGSIRSLAVDPSGALYIGDRLNNRIFKVDLDGRLRTVAGNGFAGLSGDSGSATRASLGGADLGVAVANDGTIYVADAGNNRVRRIAKDGTIATAAGGGAPADGVGDGGRATEAALSYPCAVAVDPQGNLYIAERYGHRVRIVSSDGMISTFAGAGVSGGSGDNGPAKLATIHTPEALALDKAGNLYIADVGNGRIRKVTRAGLFHPGWRTGSDRGCRRQLVRC